MLDTLRFILNDALNLGFAYGLLALGIFISYRLLDFADLTAEGSFTLGGAFVAALIFNGANPFLATLLSIVVGFVAGIITGLLHTKLKIPSLLSGIITMTALFSINMILMGIGKTGKFDSAVYLGNSKTIYDYIGIFKQKYLNIIVVNFLVITLATMFCYWLFGTEFGMSLRATGMNQKMARAQGINTSFMIIIGLGISNALISLSGALTAQTNQSADCNMGVGTLVIGLASIIVGEAIFGKRSFLNWIISVALGSVLYYLIIGIAINLGLDSYLLKLLYAILIIIVLTAPFIKKGFMKLKRKES